MSIYLEGCIVHTQINFCECGCGDVVGAAMWIEAGENFFERDLEALRAFVRLAQPNHPIRTMRDGNTLDLTPSSTKH